MVLKRHLIHVLVMWEHFAGTINKLCLDVSTLNSELLHICIMLETLHCKFGENEWRKDSMLVWNMDGKVHF